MRRRPEGLLLPTSTHYQNNFALAAVAFTGVFESCSPFARCALSVTDQGLVARKVEALIRFVFDNV